MIAKPMVALMVNKALTGTLVMAATMKYLRAMTEAIFACQMQRAAVRITTRQRVFGRQGG
jgi:hypothetical protein